MKKNLLYIIAANLLYLLVVAGTNFVLPKFTTIEVYAATKEYTLYLTTCSGVLTLGYLQGMYIEYGGKELEKINPEQVGVNIASFFCFMLPISAAILMAGVLLHHTIITILGIGILSTNLLSYYQMLFQATGDFKAYGKALNMARIAQLAVYFFLIFVVKTDSMVLYVATPPAVDISAAIYLTISCQKKVPFLPHMQFRLKMVKRNIRNGFILMLGDFITKFFSTLDRWFVNALMDTFSFAMYSFAVSMENLVNTFMTPVTISMFNYFCKKPSVEEVRQTKDIALIYSFVIIAGAYPSKWILEHFMQEYMASSVVIFPLFAAQGLSAIIRGIYVNKYKAEDQQKTYLVQMLSMLVLAAVLNAVFYWVSPSMASLAIATLTTNMIWLAVCERKNREIRYHWNAVASIAILLLVFMVTGYCMNAVSGCLVYLLAGVLVGVTLMHNRFFYVVGFVWDTVKGVWSKHPRT